MFPTTKKRNSSPTSSPTSQPPIKRQRPSDLTWDDIKFPTSPNYRDSSHPRILSLNSPRWLFTREQVESIIEYKFTKPELLREAMYPMPAGWACITDIDGSPDKTFEKGNQKLAHVGDSLLKTTAVDTWFWRMEKAHQLHKELQLYSKNDFLNAAAEEKGLSRVVKVWFRNGVIEGKKTEATTMEAVIGAVWYDSGNDMREIRRLLDLLLGTDLVREWEAHYPRLG